jgi:Mn2+/Fe2+ NRAMP family transporter
MSSPNQAGVVQRVLSVLLWSAIAGAFIGPGTVTTAASAGAGFGLQLIWALVFSTAACFLLQEAAAHLTVASGQDLGQALRQRTSGAGAGVLVLLLVLGAIVVGCAAYQAGNVLGAVAGATRVISVSPRILTLLIGGIAAILLSIGNPSLVARSLSVLVALMGVVFLLTAAGIGPGAADLLNGAIRPSLPPGSGALVIGLIGTTVVPYNLFLGSGLARGEGLRDMRFGLAIAIGLGGVISISILVVGSAVDGPFSYDALVEVLTGRFGPWAGGLFGWGLFAAGLSSAVTAPLAAAMTARSLFGDERWHARSWRFRAIWIGVLATGVAFGVAGLQPIPVIILAQALNGLLLPFVAVFLLLACNDRSVVGERGLSRPWHTLSMAFVVLVALVLGLSNLSKAVVRALALPALSQSSLLIGSTVVAAVLAVPIARAVRQRRRFEHRDRA